jgi:hypothetical protein
VRVYLGGTGKGDAVEAFAQLSRVAAARRFQVVVDDPVALASGSGRFFINVAHAETPKDAIAVVRALLDQIPGCRAALEPLLDRVQVDVAGNFVDIGWDERERLLERLRDVAGSGTIVERFWAVGVSGPVKLDAMQRSRLRVTLELWGISVLPEGLARLLIALVQADPRGDVSAL